MAETELNKDNANASKYYKLFADKVGKFKDGEKILFIHIGNFNTLNMFISSNPNCEYSIIDQHLNGPWFELNWPNVKFIGTNEDDSIIKAINIMKKFDKIIMNPPYSKNLHLKILAEAIKHLNEDGTCINLSPIRWLQDPFNQFKNSTDLMRFNNEIIHHLKNVDIILAKDANKVFNIALYANLGIYECTEKSLNINYNDFWKKGLSDIARSIFEKVSLHKKSIENKCETNKIDGIRVLVAAIAGNRGTLPVYKELSYVIDGKKDGKDWTKCKNNGGYEKVEGSAIPISIKFNTEIEAENFYNSCKTTFYKFICKFI